METYIGPNLSIESHTCGTSTEDLYDAFHYSFRKWNAKEDSSFFFLIIKCNLELFIYFSVYVNLHRENYVKFGEEALVSSTVGAFFVMRCDCSALLLPT